MSTLALKDYWTLTKPRVVSLILFTAVVGMLLAVPGLPPADKFWFGLLGIALIAGAAAALNQLIDREIDARMARTMDRPLPTGRLDVRSAFVFAALLAVVGTLVLVLWVNVLTAVLTLASLLGYAVVYTVYLKRATPQNIVIGGAAGAAPPVLGWAAITGSLAPLPYLLFLIIFLWTPPHFWALAIYRREDYAAASIPMLPVTHGDELTRWHIFYYTILLFVITLMPYLVGSVGWLYLAGAVVLGVWYLSYAVRMLKNESPLLAFRSFKFSIWYLFGLFALLLLDHYLLL